MINIEDLKRTLSPVTVAQHYLGVGKRKGDKIWYRSPFRNERTASFMVDEKSFHDFGENWDGDVISFIERYYNVTFKDAIQILSRDFMIPETDMNEDLKKYIIKQNKEKQQMQQNLDNWFYSTFIKIQEEIKEWKKLIPYLQGETIKMARKYITDLEIIHEEFCEIKEEDKIELWRQRKTIDKKIILR